MFTDKSCTTKFSALILIGKEIRFIEPDFELSGADGGNNAVLIAIVGLFKVKSRKQTSRESKQPKSSCKRACAICVSIPAV